MNFSLCIDFNFDFDFIFKRKEKKSIFIVDYNLIDTQNINEADISRETKVKLIMNILKDCNDYIILKKGNTILYEIGVKNYVKTYNISTNYPIFKKDNLIGCIILGKYDDEHITELRIDGQILEILGNLI